MLRTTLRSLWSHKRRLISTCVAVMLGVAFMSGTFVLNSTVGKVFDDLFGDITAGIDAEVRGPVTIEADFGTLRGTLPAETADQVAALESVGDAEAYVATETISLIDKDGDVVGGIGPPTITESWIISETMNPFQVAEGRAPEAAGELVLNRAAAKSADYQVGDEVTLLTADGREKFELVGITMFGDAESAAGTTLVGVTMEEAQRLSGQAGNINTVQVEAAPGFTEDQLVADIEGLDLAGGAEAVTGTQAGEELAGDLKQGFGFFTQMLQIFAGVALFVGMFIISNTFAILIAQRTRELALLRAIGASRRQVMMSVLLEAGMVGLISAILGFVAGIGLAALSLFGIRAAGIDLPGSGISVDPGSLVAAVIVGLLITIASALMPAIRATRVPPLAALRDVAIDQSSRSRVRLVIGVLLLVVGVVFTLPAFGDDPVNSDVPGVGIGAAMLIAGILMLGPVLVRPLAQAAGSWLPRVKGITGRLARDNAVRNPGRTASTAAALIISVTLVGFIMIFANSAQKSIPSEIERGVKGDYLIQQANQASLAGASPAMAEELAAIDGVEHVTAMNFGLASLEFADGGEAGQAAVRGVDPETVSDVFNLSMREGDVLDLTDDGIIVDRQEAQARGLSIGDNVHLVAMNGSTLDLTVAALSDDPMMLGQWSVTRSALASVTDQPLDVFVGVGLADGVGVDEIRPDLRAVVDEYPTMKLQDREQFSGALVDLIQQLLYFIYGLLGLSVIIALIGVGNTVSLAVRERTRELGLLRATGMTRAQLRSAIRWEAAIVAILGTGLGLLLSIVTSWVLVKVLVSQGLTIFAVPVSGMLVLIIGGALFGIMAALWPAWKASRLNVLEAIATE